MTQCPEPYGVTGFGTAAGSSVPLMRHNSKLEDLVRSMASRRTSIGAAMAHRAFSDGRLGHFSFANQVH